MLGLIAGGLAYTANFRGLLLITFIDAISLFKTRSIFGFILNDLVGLVLLFAVNRLWHDLGGL